MLVHVYLIDYYKDERDNGLDSYVNELSKDLLNRSNVLLSHVWINCKNTTLLKEQNNKKNELFVPTFNPSREKDLSFDLFLTNVLINDIGVKENVIIHLNWINHLGLAWHLKQKTVYRIILTKHCLPWRDFLYINYKDFYKLNEAYTKVKPITISNSKLIKEQLGYENIDHIITVTDCAKFSLTHLFKISAHKITVVANGINPKGLKTQLDTKDSLRKKNGFSLNDQILLFAGNVHTRKGIIDVVRFFDKVAGRKGFENLRLVIAGPGDHSLVLRTAKRSWAKITLTGSLNKNMLYEFYKLADIGIIPSYAEQCSYTCIEMMHSGLPIIVSNVDGLKEMVKNECGLKVEVDYRKTGVSISSKNLKEKINFYLKKPAEAKRLADNARNYALQHFTAERMVEETSAVYNKVIAEQNNNEIQKQKLNAIVDEPLVSIILPCHNAEKYLGETLSSIFNHNYSNFEVIVVNDGSTDNTANLVHSFQDKRLIYLNNRSNKGITYSLNKAIKHANGKYIARIDADDRMLENRLNLQVDFLENNKEYGMVGSWISIIDSFGMPVNRTELMTENDDLKIAMLFRNPFAHPAVTMRTEIVKQLKYSTHFKYCEDYDLWFRIAAQNKVKNLPIMLTEYRVHELNSSSKNSRIMKQSVIKLISRELNKLNIRHSQEELVLHAAITFGLEGRFFNTPEKIEGINNWLDRIFSSQTLNEKCNRKSLMAIKDQIIQNLL